MALREGVSARSGAVESLLTAQYVMLAAMATDGGLKFDPFVVIAGESIWLAQNERALSDANTLVYAGILRSVATSGVGDYFTLTTRGAELVRLYALVNISPAWRR